MNNSSSDKPSDTPRTDEQDLKSCEDTAGYAEMRGFARQLERELAEVKQDREGWIETLRKAEDELEALRARTPSAVTFTPPSARAVEWAERFMVQPGDPLIGGLAIAEAAREILRLAKMTPSATASVGWEPFDDYMPPGDCVLIKPGDLHKPLVAEGKDGRWWIHDPIALPDRPARNP